MKSLSSSPQVNQMPGISFREPGLNAFTKRQSKIKHEMDERSQKCSQLKARIKVRTRSSSLKLFDIRELALITLFGQEIEEQQVEENSILSQNEHRASIDATSPQHNKSIISQ